MNKSEAPEPISYEMEYDEKYSVVSVIQSILFTKEYMCMLMMFSDGSLIINRDFNLDETQYNIINQLIDLHLVTEDEHAWTTTYNLTYEGHELYDKLFGE